MLMVLFDDDARDDEKWNGKFYSYFVSV